MHTAAILLVTPVPRTVTFPGCSIAIGSDDIVLLAENELIIISLQLNE